MTSQRDWADLAGRLALRVNFDLMTVLEVDWNENLVRRSFSTDETNYPSGGVKRLMGSSWANHVIFGGQAFRSQTRAEFRSAFEDYKTLEALDLFFALNVPCQEWGRTVRTVNLLRGTSAFPEQAIEAVRQRFEFPNNPE
ncbi:hypothetical protein SAMN05444679_14019 [Variovorax sp. CF079]|uniref:hypothetical protein n=1 Tax=Variovorax sp. CF079 TaxID=1882774 RepID=UPI00088EBD9B|nr:hypothetical protein [Variovorax sp. CF079]SDE93331.1 hypothetical protein SAMN05444679_14019 [Variovorax sp. CF079]